MRLPEPAALDLAWALKPNVEDLANVNTVSQQSAALTMITWLDTAVAEVDPVLPCPECRANKHHNCDASAWDTERDMIVQCPCLGRGHRAA